MLYYVKTWSESARGGASMITAEYTTDKPPHSVGERREIQDPRDKDSGWDCSLVDFAKKGDLDLPYYGSSY